MRTLDKAFLPLWLAEVQKVYFLIAHDWDFEESLAKLGCIIRAYDPSVDKPHHITYPNLHFEKIGKSSINARRNLKGYQMKLFGDLLLRNGDVGKEITYLKLDVEGYELEALEAMMDRESLKNVKQIGIEMHTG